MDFDFTPTEMTQKLDIPFLEDARASTAPFYATTKKPERIQAEIIDLIVELGGGGVQFQEGIFGSNPARHGYRITFWLGAHQGLIRCAGLPIRYRPDKKKNQALAQALSIVREWLRSALTSQIFSPGAHPLVQYLLVGDGQRTWVEALMAREQLPLLNPSGEDDHDAGTE